MSEYTGDEYAFGRNPNLQRSAAGRLLTGPSRFRETREARGMESDLIDKVQDLVTRGRREKLGNMHLKRREQSL